MNIDRNFGFLNKGGNSLNKGKNSPYNTAYFIKDSTLKYLIPTLTITVGSFGINNNYGESQVKEDIRYGDAIHVNKQDTYIDIPQPKTTISGEIPGEKRNIAPGEFCGFKTGNELNYLKKYIKLSDEDYKKLFTGFVDVRQGYFGDCYLVSTIKSLARSKYFDMLIKISIQKNSDGSFILTLPLGNPNGKKIHISKDELNLAKIKGSDGYKILEVGFAKELLFRKNGSLLHIGDMPDIKLAKESMNNIIGGNSFNALAVLLGYSKTKKQLITNNPKRRNLILNELKKFNPRNGDLIIVSSCRRPKGIPSSQKTYKMDGQSMYYHHAYSLYAVEKRGNHIESIILEDPANNRKKIKLSLFGFMLSFFQITTCSPMKGFLYLA